MYSKEDLELYLAIHAEWKKDCKEGPWTHEPDLHEFEYKGYKCYILRSLSFGGLCGYVEIPTSIHLPFDVDDLNIHGGVTWDEDHLPSHNEGPGYRYIGFHCANSYDYMPKLQNTIDRIDDPLLKELKEHALKMRESLAKPEGIEPFKSTYKDMDFVIKELHSLVDQIQEKIKDQQ